MLISQIEISTEIATIVGSSLLAVIGVLWKLLLDRFKTSEAQVESQRKDLIKLTREVGELNGKQEGLKIGVESTTQKVIKEIKELTPKEDILNELKIIRRYIDKCS